MKKSSKFFTGLILATTLTSCLSSGKSGGSSQPTINPFPISLPNGQALTAVSGPNVMNITVNGPGCSNSYPNKPCASVTICEPGTANCVTVNDLLVDTGSFGLRVFKSALGGLSLPPVLNSSAVPVAQCVHFGDGSSDWGPVKSADVVLGEQAPVTTSIQVIDSTYFAGHYSCASPDAGPADAGFNGILGVGVFAQDCGPGCARTANNGMYYACSGSSCAGTRLALESQVQNPVAIQPLDNNGVILQLPNVTARGVASVNGYLIMGIGTRSNNIPGNVQSYAAHPDTGRFLTSFNGRTYESFIDSGSNGLFFPSGALPDCGGNFTGWFCPSGQTLLTATNSAYTGLPSGTFEFQVMSMRELLSNPNAWVFPTAAGSSGSDGIGGWFDWGLPFYIGRNVYLGIEGSSSSLGMGPYWAY